MDMQSRELSERAGISLSYASEIVNGKRQLGLVAALNIFRRSGIKLGPLAGMDDEAATNLAQSTPASESAAA